MQFLPLVVLFPPLPRRLLLRTFVTGGEPALLSPTLRAPAALSGNPERSITLPLQTSVSRLLGCELHEGRAHGCLGHCAIPGIQKRAW